MESKVRLMHVVGDYAGGVKNTVDILDQQLLEEEDLHSISLVYCKTTQAEEPGFADERRLLFSTPGHPKKMEVGMLYTQKRHLVAIRSCIAHKNKYLQEGISVSLMALFRDPMINASL